MAEIDDLQILDSNNGTRTDALWPEGMPMANVNDGGRADEGILARWFQDENGSLVSTGTSSAYLVSPRRDTSGTFPANFYDGLVIAFKPHVNNAAGATIGVGGAEFTAPIILPNGDSLPADILTANVPVTIVWSASQVSWIVVSFCAIGQFNSVIADLVSAESNSLAVIRGRRTAFSAGFQNALSVRGYALNSVSAEVQATQIQHILADSTSGAEVGQIRFDLIDSGVLGNAYFMDTTAFRPAGSGVRDLGSVANPFRDIYITGTVNIVGGSEVRFDTEVTPGSITLNGSPV